MILTPYETGGIIASPEEMQPLSTVKLIINKSQLDEANDFDIAFNKTAYQKYYEGMLIPEGLRNSPNLTIKIRDRKTLKVYKTDPFVIRDITYVGKSIDDVYPESMKHIYDKIQSMEDLIKRMEQKIIELSEEGTVV